ncbi:hypothetical protein BANRA_04975 [Klebsiella pneumoniae]|nr:hypothetical protein BANRA_04975 [Klebsiella pneumoniae]
MLKNSLMFLVIILLTACHHTPDGIKRYLRLTLALLKQLKCQEGYRKYSVRVVNAGIDVYIIIDNGYNEFMTQINFPYTEIVADMSLRGVAHSSRCSQYIWFLM